MNKKLCAAFMLFVLIGTAVLVFLHLTERSTRSAVDPAIVKAAADSSRASQQQALPQEDIPREGRARPGAMASPK